MELFSRFVCAIRTHHSPFEDVLGYVSRRRGVPLNGMGVLLASGFCYNHMNRTITTCEIKSAQTSVRRTPPHIQITFVINIMV